jgi:predicted RNA-binding Zn-ribbon protein involved in translation (DUF1610 family)
MQKLQLGLTVAVLGVCLYLTQKPECIQPPVSEAQEVEEAGDELNVYMLTEGERETLDYACPKCGKEELLLLRIYDKTGEWLGIGWQCAECKERLD